MPINFCLSILGLNHYVSELARRSSSSQRCWRDTSRSHERFQRLSCERILQSVPAQTNGRRISRMATVFPKLEPQLQGLLNVHCGPAKSRYSLPHPRMTLFNNPCCIGHNVNLYALKPCTGGRRTKQLLSFEPWPRRETNAPSTADTPCSTPNTHLVVAAPTSRFLVSSSE